MGENARREKARLREQKREQRRVLKEVQEARERAQKAKEAAEAKQQRRREKKRSTTAPKGDRRFRGDDDDDHVESHSVHFTSYSADEIDEQWRAFETSWAGFFGRRSSPPLSSANTVPWPERSLLAQYLKNSVRAADAAQRKRQLVMTFHPDKVKQKLSAHLTPEALSDACTITSELCKQILAAWP